MNAEMLEQRRPLDGTVVLEVVCPTSPVCIQLAVAFAGRQAADLGARVIRLEAVGEDVFGQASNIRSEGYADNQDIYAFLNAGKTVVVSTNRLHDIQRFLGKRMSAVLASEGDKIIALAQAVDIPLVEFATWPSTMKQQPAELSEFTVLATSGLLAMIGDPEGEPLRFGGHQPSYATGLAGFSALSALLAARDAGRRWQPARVSLVETMLWVNWKAVCAAATTGKSPNRRGSGAEFQTVPCADGFVAIVYTASRFSDLIELIGDPRLEDAKFSTRSSRQQHVDELYDVIRGWCKTKTRAQIYTEAQDANVPFGPVWTPAELLDDAQYLARHFYRSVLMGDMVVAMPRLPLLWNGVGFPPRPVQTSAIDDLLEELEPHEVGEHPSQVDESAPLAGIRVIDFGQLTAGANTSAMLADLGADVIKVESAENLDLFRLVESGDRTHGWWNRSALFDFSNRNKRGICIDLKTKEGNRLIRDLIDQSHVVIENFRRGVVERLGIDYQSVSSTNREIVFASISSQGETGPYRKHISFGSTLDATGGMASITGYVDGPPVISGGDINYPDQVVSLFATGMVILAIRDMRRTGQGAHLDLSQREIASFLIGEESVAASAGRAGTPLRRGNGAENARLQRCFLCGDKRWVAVTLRDDKALTRVADWLGAERHSHDVIAKLIPWFARHGAAVAEAALRELGLPAAVVLDGTDHLRDAQLRANTSFEMPDGKLLKGTPYVFGNATFLPHRTAPDLGEHTAEVLRDVLRRSPEEIEHLAAVGITSAEPRRRDRP